MVSQLGGVEGPSRKKIEETHRDQCAEVEEIPDLGREQLHESVVAAKPLRPLPLQLLHSCAAHLSFGIAFAFGLQVRVQVCKVYVCCIPIAPGPFLLLIRALLVLRVLLVRCVNFLRVEVEQLPSHPPGHACFTCAWPWPRSRKFSRRRRHTRG